jgi:predicted DNA-binding transcriptional regulator AlpA
MVTAGEFPARRHMKNRPAISGWPSSEVSAWLEANLVPAVGGTDDDDEDAS